MGFWDVVSGVGECAAEAFEAAPGLGTLIHGPEAVMEIMEADRAEQAGDSEAAEIHGKAALLQTAEAIPFIGAPVALGSAIQRQLTGEGFGDEPEDYRKEGHE
jgi:hypothetical protein